MYMLNEVMCSSESFNMHHISVKSFLFTENYFFNKTKFAWQMPAATEHFQGLTWKTNPWTPLDNDHYL